MAITLGDWHKADEVLLRHVDSENPSILRDLGIVLCKMNKNKPNSHNYKKGQCYLEKTCGSPNENVDALASLAGNWKGIDEEKVRELYRKAFQLDSSNPYTLSNYLDLEISRDTSIVKGGGLTTIPLDPNSGKPGCPKLRNFEPFFNKFGKSKSYSTILKIKK